MNRIGASAMVVSLAAVLGASACSGGAGATQTPAPATPTVVPATPTIAPVMSTEAIHQVDADRRAFGERYFGALPDVQAVSPQLADDATFYDPTDGDLYRGRNLMERLLLTVQGSYPDLDYTIMNVYLSSDGALYQLEATGLWPPWVPTPPDHPPVHEIQAVRLEDGLLGYTEFAFPVDEMEMFPLGCFRDHGCSDQYEQLVNGYVSAWSSGDAAQIAALYRDDAVFTDSMLGLSAHGAPEIGQLAQTRFGGASDVSIEVLNSYTQTNGYAYPYSKHPYVGAIIAAVVGYRATATVNGQAASLDSFTFLRFASWTPAGLDTDPDGRIVEERVFHDAASLSSWLDAMTI